MLIHNYVPGEADHEAGVFDAAAARLPGFRPVTGEAIRRAVTGPGFDPGTRFYAEADGQDLLWYGTSRMETNTFSALGTQVPADVPHMRRFYERCFARRGASPSSNATWGPRF